MNNPEKINSKARPLIPEKDREINLKKRSLKKVYGL